MVNEMCQEAEKQSCGKSFGLSASVTKECCTPAKKLHSYRHIFSIRWDMRIRILEYPELRGTHMDHVAVPREQSSAPAPSPPLGGRCRLPWGRTSVSSKLKVGDKPLIEMRRAGGSSPHFSSCVPEIQGVLQIPSIFEDFWEKKYEIKSIFI